ncbi:FadR/GntR family transcriptional regulator [Humibacter soli]
MASSVWKPVRQGNVSDLIAERILEVIESGSLRPGDRLPPERELATLLGTSRPSLREAMQRLKAQGRVDVRHGTGVFVAENPTTRSLQSAVANEQMTLTELYDMREVLELPAAAWAASSRRPEKLAQVQAAFDALMRASERDEIDWRELQTLDAAFHMSIVEAAGNRFLIRTLGVLQQILAEGMETTLQIPGRLEQSREDHQRILNAVLEGDPVAAREAAARHVDGARRAALSRVTRQLADREGNQAEGA